MSEQRNSVFISHANPQDNDFSRWLSLRLVAEGYSVWCDVLRLRGGNPTWDVIEDQIRHKTAKFIFVASKAANSRDGTKRELDTALVVRTELADPNFVTPIYPDDLSYGDANIRLQGLFGHRFSNSWATGLATLLETLETHSVPRNGNTGPASATSLWREQFSAETGILKEPETYCSNWFAISHLPPLFIHTVYRSTQGPIELVEDPTVPAHLDGLTLFSFAEHEEVKPFLRSSKLEMDTTTSFDIASYLAGDPSNAATRKRFGCVRALVRKCWEKFALRKGLLPHALANRATCFYFSDSLLQGKWVPFVGPGDRAGERALAGFRTVGGRKRYWHFAVEMKPVLVPEPRFVLKTHVLFSDDATTVWESKRKLQSARMSQCKNWWNPHWRDRSLASVSWLADGADRLIMPVSGTTAIEVARLPDLFSSPVAYRDPKDGTDEGADDGDPDIDDDADDDDPDAAGQHESE
ncbi:MAG: toll/interleukin-1 receptor domain-containing protein [Bryobacteraceae bacterium]